MTLYVEGGGDTSALRAQCRRAFSKLLEKTDLAGRMPRIVACGSRRAAYDDFRTAQKQRRAGDYPILLVDSEEPVTLGAWAHLKQRDRWTRPGGAQEEQAQLTVTCMETWIVADRAALRELFGSQLRENALLPEHDLEERFREEVQTALEAATRALPRDRRYEKGRRSFQALEHIDPVRLEGPAERPALPHFRRLMETLRARL